MPHILISNDDGIYAKGLRALVQALEGLGTVSVAAPSEERSGASQSLTLRQPIFCEQVAEREWSIDGTPADAMMVALHRILPERQERPDLVISGINGGANLGENIFYSGTVGAAMEAAINHIPALAISVAHSGQKIDFSEAGKFARQLAEMVLEKGLPPETLLNVNVPLGWNGEVRFTHQSKKVTRTVFQEGRDPRGRQYFWLSGDRLEGELDPQSDFAAIRDGAVSITPLELDRTCAASLNHLSHWAERLARPPAVR